MQTYPAVSIVSLCLAYILPLFSHVDHTTVHGECLSENSICKIGQTSFAKGIDASFRQCQIDRLRYVRDVFGVSEILRMSAV